MGLLGTMDLGVFKRLETWKAFAIAAIMFVCISYAALSMFDSMDDIFQSDAEPEPIPNIVFESLNRTGIESELVNETGWFNLDDLRGSVIIFDMMAHDCSNCHAVQYHLEERMPEWEDIAAESGKSFHIIAYGSWYGEDLAYLNESDANYDVPLYPTGMGSADSGTLTGGKVVDPVRLFTTAGTGQIPVVMVIDEEGYIIERQATGSPTDKWRSFDSVVELALSSQVEETANLRIAWEEPSTSYVAVFALGMILSILVYFSPCAFPVLPGFISYYLSLGAREDELIAAGKLNNKMPSPVVIGSLSGFGMWTFFLLIGIVAFVMGGAFQKSGLVHLIAVGIAILLIILGSMMLLGVTSHVMGFVQKFVDKYSTTEDDDIFTPRRNMYLYGIGYALSLIHI